MDNPNQDKLASGKPETKQLTDNVFDITIIGAGVVGCAIARRFTLAGAKVAVVEKASDILDGASKANSAILHTGFDAPKDSIELSCVQNGYEEYKKIHADLGLPIDNCGAYVVAWNEKEQQKLESILQKAHANGVSDTHLISAKQLAKSENNLTSHARAAISIPDEAIIDPWSAPYAYLKQAIINGAEVFTSCEVETGQFENGQWLIKTSRGILRTKYIINAAGLYGDLLDKKLLGETGFNITPRKGQFVVFDKAAASLINSVILPVPTKRTKGIVIFRTIFGNLAIGPTAEDQVSRTNNSTDEKSIKQLIAAGVERIPLLKDMPITATYAGLRPASEFSDYQIKANEAKNWITIGAIRSTGLSGALGIANYAFELYQKSGNKHKKIRKPQIPQTVILAEKSQRDWKNKDHGKIICHCELVSEREIKQALSGELAAKSLAGLKRQTRVTMGRCQGFFCSANLAKITKTHFEIPLASESKND